MHWLEWLVGLCGVLGLFYLLMPWMVRPGWWLVVNLRYGLKVRGAENVPRSGPVVLVANHVTWVDGFVLTAACPRRAYFLVNADYVNLPVVRHIARRLRMIPVPASGPRAQRAAIAAAQAILDRGELIALFPEGQLSRNGLTGTFRRGLEALLHHREAVPVIPVALDNLWGSIFSHAGGRFFSHWPRGWRHRVGIAFGPPLAPPVTAVRARQAVVETAVRAFELRRPTDRDRPLETIDPALPRFDHPTLGQLAASTADYRSKDVQQTGQKAGTVGLALPGVALRVVDDQGKPLGVDLPGQLQALKAGYAEWIDTGCDGRIDRDGFVSLVGSPQENSPVA